MNIFWRFVVAAIVAWLVIWALPPFFSLIGVVPPAALLQLIRIAIVAGALYYVITGRSIPPVN